ncbi:MAG: hypothetical protein OEZ36_12520, partial [Spirochaetota bacterium]|nr:hypothetical protein [Spirochaetota bacterium]
MKKYPLAISYILLLTLSLSCDPFDTDSYFPATLKKTNPVTSLFLSPYSITLATSSTYTFTAKGGKSPYTYSIISGTGTINSTTGLYTAPAAAETGIVQVTDAVGTIYTSVVTVSVVTGLSVNPLAITVEKGDSVTFSAVGGTSPYTYSYVSGVGGTITSAGIYTAPGTTGSEIIRVTDSTGATSDTTITIGHPGLPVISPATVTLAINSSQTFTTTGGYTPYTYSLLLGSGTIDAASGLYTAPATTGTVIIRVTDS